jgi:hypothetical protein
MMPREEELADAWVVPIVSLGVLNEDGLRNEGQNRVDERGPIGRAQAVDGRSEPGQHWGELFFALTSRLVFARVDVSTATTTDQRQSSA